MTAAMTPLLLLLSPGCPTDEPVRVTVVVVLATTANNKVDPALVDLAKAVQAHDGKLTGFRVEVTEAKSIAVGESASFALVEKQELKVTVTRPKGADGKIALTLKAPKLEKITYGCACDRFFPIATPYRTKNGEVLIVAVMAKPCTLGKKAKGWFPWPG
jgi:hypothetical protein